MFCRGNIVPLNFFGLHVEVPCIFCWLNLLHRLVLVVPDLVCFFNLPVKGLMSNDKSLCTCGVALSYAPDGPELIFCFSIDLLW